MQQTKRLLISGMTCQGCEKRIERALLQKEGVKTARVEYTSGTAEVTYEEATVSLGDLEQAVKQLGYGVGRTKGVQTDQTTRIMGAVILLFAAWYLLHRLPVAGLFNAFPQATEGMGYEMVFVVGLLTSVHCIAMCGGISLTQCLGGKGCGRSRFSTLRPGLLYNGGRVVSYTVVGVLVGAAGSAISFSGNAKGMVQLAAGVFMIVMGLNMLGVFPGLRALTPRLPRFLQTWVDRRQETSTSPFYIGLLNGLMPCGPLQAMQLYALSTGSPVRGGLSMLLFSLGTVPLMLGFGALSTLLSKRFTHRVMTVGAAVVVVMGLSMLQNGMALSGWGLRVADAQGEAVPAKVVDDVQVVRTDLSAGRYAPIAVQKGIPVVWTIVAEEGSINGCNNRMRIPEYGIEHSFHSGDNVIAFTPGETGTYTYSCWMGMIRSTITVTDGGDAP